MARFIGLCLMLLTTTTLWAQPVVEWMTAYLGGARCVAEMAEIRYLVGGDFTGAEWGGAIGSYDTAGTGIVWNYNAAAQYGYRGVLPTTDGKYLWCGARAFYVVKTDTAGTIFWEKNYPGQGRVLGDPCPTLDGGYLLASVEDADAAVYARLLKLNSLGDSLCAWRYGGPGSGELTEIRLVRGFPEGYLLIGATGQTGATRYGLALRVNENCDSLWTRACGSAAGQLFTDAQALLDGGFLLAGVQVSATQDSSAWLLRLDAAGETVWSRALPGGRAIGAMKPTWDGHYIVAGSGRDGALWIAKVNAAGDTLWTQSAPGAVADPACMRVLPAADRGYLVTAAAWPVSLVKFTPDTAGMAPLSPHRPLPETARLLDNYPNPFNGQTVIRYAVAAPGPLTLAVYDVGGRQVATLAEGPHGAGEYSARFNAAALPSGVYFYRLETTGGAAQTRKMMLLK